MHPVQEMFESCAQIRQHYSDCVDGVAASGVLRSVRYHLRYCPACREELDRAEALRDHLRSLPRHAVPPAAGLQLKVALSRTLHQNFWGRLGVRIDNRFRTLLLPATGGLLAAVFCFCLLMGSEVAPLNRSPDVPVSFVTPARVISLAPFDFSTGDNSIVIVTYIGADGQVLRYHVISGPHSPQFLHSLDRMIYFSQYTPATAFGSPTEGEVVLSLRQVTIRG